MQVQVEMSSDGELRMSPMSPEIDGTWCDYACAARDRHEQNVEVFVDDTVGGRVAARTTRTVLRGHELFVWFEDSLARQRNIPILTPANIRGLTARVITAWCHGRKTTSGLDTTISGLSETANTIF